MKTELVIVNKQLGFRPPIEELRDRYYREIKNFITIPSRFQGVGGNVGI